MLILLVYFNFIKIFFVRVVWDNNKKYLSEHKVQCNQHSKIFGTWFGIINVNLFWCFVILKWENIKNKI